MKIRDFVDLIAPGTFGLGVITLGDVQAVTAILVGLVTIACTIAVTIHKLRKE